MSKIKKFFISFLTLIFAAFTTSLNIFAAQPQLPDGFEKLSVEQRIQWMDENLKQTTEYATSMINTRNILPLKIITIQAVVPVWLALL